MNLASGSAFLALFCCCSVSAFADQGVINNSGNGSAVVSGGLTTINATSVAPAGTLAITATSAGGTVTFLSADGTESLNGTISTSSTVESCAGGGRGGHISCGYSFSASFKGTLTVNGETQAILGTSYESFAVGGAPTGATVYNSAYTPFYFTNSGQLIRNDDINGTNQLVYGSYKNGVGQFYGITGVALDAQGRIYVTDTYNARVVRIDDMYGTNWTSFGTSGSGPGQFLTPLGIAIDPQGRIYVADSGNGCLVRMDDMNGTNWTTFCSAGSGTGQLSNFSAIMIDAGGHIYIPDSANNRVVRMDDILGTNWTVLSQLPGTNGTTYPLQAPFAVGVDAAGKIYIAESSAVVRVDNMSGANWTSLSASGFHSMNVDSTGMVLFGGYGLEVIDGMAAAITSPNLPSSFGSYYVWGITPIPLPTLRPPAMTISATALTFANQNINTTSVAQSVTVTNFGGSPLQFSSILTNGGFVQTNNCGSSLIAGSSCTVNVSFAPTTSGPASGTLMISDNSGNMGTAQIVALSGSATQPQLFVSPVSLLFPAQLLNTASATQNVIVQNTGTGPLLVSLVSATLPFAQTNNCSAAIAPGAACTIGVSFDPTATGSVTGTLAINTNAGTQGVTLAGSGTTSAASVTVTPSQLLFPAQLVGSRSAAQTVTITNTGKTAVANKAPTISGDFSETTTCTASLAAGKSCTVSVTFAPTTTGVRNGVLTLNLASGAQSVPLAGSGSGGSSPGVLSLTPSSITFNNGYVVGDNPSQTLTVTNTSGAVVGIAGIAFSGDPSIKQKSKCGATLAASASCSITVTFTPKTAGTFTSTLTLTESSGALDVVAISATAGAAGSGN